MVLLLLLSSCLVIVLLLLLILLFLPPLSLSSFLLCFKWSIRVVCFCLSAISLSEYLNLSFIFNTLSMSSLATASCYWLEADFFWLLCLVVLFGLIIMLRWESTNRELLLIVKKLRIPIVDGTCFKSTSSYGRLQLAIVSDKYFCLTRLRNHNIIRRT